AASGVFLGLTAASKYIYAVVGIAILVHSAVAVATRQRAWRSGLILLAWGALAALTFLSFDPYLWPDPVGRLTNSIAYNYDYSHSDELIKWGNYPWWQPILWLMDAFRFADPNPRWALMINVDFPIFLLSLIGLPRLFRQRSPYAYWYVTAISFLLLW